jgi:hypothetical protein
VRLTEANLGPFLAALGSGFEADEEMLRDAIRRGRSANIFSLPEIVKIDLFVRGAHAFDRSEFSRKMRVEIPGEGAIFAASPEDTILRKLVWFREGGEVSDAQWRDILGVIRSGAELDRDYLSEWSRRLGVQELLERAMAQAEFD